MLKWNFSEWVKKNLLDVKSEVTTHLAQTASIKANDVVSLHVGDRVEILRTEFHTILDISSPTILLGGSAYGFALGYRITVDGDVVINATGLSRGRLNDESPITAISFPHVVAKESLKVELYNPLTASDRDFGWRVMTK